MCRLFGFRSQQHLSACHPLIGAENALVVQSRQHRDGWGVAYFENRLPTIHKGTAPACDDCGFSTLCQALSSDVLIAHVRQATVGSVAPQNTHPFHYESWVFAHNGTVYGFQKLRPYFLEEMTPHLRSRIQGSTDSEHCFYLLLSELEALNELHEVSAQDLEEALAICLQKIASWCRLVGIREAPCMNFMISNGSLFAATRLGRDLYFATQHHPEDISSDASRHDNAVIRYTVERHTRGRPIARLLVASERISAEEAWEEVPNNAVLVLDEAMNFRLRRDVAELSQLEFSPLASSLHSGGIAS
ncbi:MAG: class II glutamine amidotransferase [Myxococcota bacterium]